MILFLEYSSGGIRGGEIYSARVHSFLKSRFDDVMPDTISPIPSDLKNPLAHLLYAHRLTRKMRPELIVMDVSSGVRNFGAIRWMKRHGKKILLLVLEQRLKYKWDFSVIRHVSFLVEKKLVKSADMILVISEYSASLAARKGAGPGVPIIIAPPGMENFVRRAEGASFAVPPADGSFRMLYVGKCVWHKGLRYLVEAVEMLGDLDLRLDIVGSFDPRDSYYKSLARFVADRGLSERVVFRGFVSKDELIRFFTQASIYAHPSLMEGYGMVLAEAMSFGLPIVATTAGAIPELVEDGINGNLVAPRDSEALAAAIRRMHDDRDYRERISACNLRKVRSLATWSDFEAILDKELVPAIENIAGIKAKASGQQSD